MDERECSNLTFGIHRWNVALNEDDVDLGALLVRFLPYPCKSFKASGET